MNTKVQEFVDKWGIAIGVRRRGPGSIAKIESGSHVGKVYNNKAKNISVPDHRYLGFANDLDTSAIKQPPLLGELEESLPIGLPKRLHMSMTICSSRAGSSATIGLIRRLRLLLKAKAGHNRIQCGAVIARRFRKTLF